MPDPPTLDDILSLALERACWDLAVAKEYGPEKIGTPLREGQESFVAGAVAQLTEVYYQIAESVLRATGDDLDA